MFYDERTTVPDSPTELEERYEAELTDIVAATGLEAAAEATGIDADRLEALELGTPTPALTLEEAAEIGALESGAPEPETIVEIACEHLLLGMSMAVLDVETLERRLELEPGLDAKEIQQKIERRAPMTFAEFVYIQHAIVSSIPSR